MVKGQPMTLQASSPSASQTHATPDAWRVGIGWSLLLVVLSCMVFMREASHGHLMLPWPLAWVAFLPSIILIVRGADRDAIVQGQLRLALIAVIGLLAMTHIEPTAPLSSCVPSWFSTFAENGTLCPNIFQYRWGHVGAFVPVGLATLLAAFGHMAWALLRNAEPTSSAPAFA